MHILVIGSGGREHALCHAIRRSPLLSRLTCAPGNGGIAQIAECITLKDAFDTVAFCQAEKVDLVVIGPEQPLVEGLADILRGSHIPAFGPSANAARLEGSKGFTKDICRTYGIPTAAYERFDNAAGARAYIERHYVKSGGAPIVVKADGLAAGKGVTVAMSKDEALRAVDEAFSGRFGEAGSSVVIEEFLEGEEASFFALCNGSEAIEFCAAQDHKRAFDGDQGPNTGGMGTYSPTPLLTEALRGEVMASIIQPTLRAMQQEGCPFQGVLFAGLMITKDGPKLIEYNARFGDPETQVMLARLASDIVPLLLACALGEPMEELPLAFTKRAALCVVMAAKGYPGEYEKGSEIRGLEKAAALQDVHIFHAGTALKDGSIVATGGRVLGVTALGDTLALAQSRAYEAVDLIDWPQGFCRRDIGARAIGWQAD